MEVMSLNCRGLASSTKKLALKRLVTKNQPYIILLQETIGSVEAITKFLKNTLKEYDFIAKDADGILGGLATG